MFLILSELSPHALHLDAAMALIQSYRLDIQTTDLNLTDERVTDLRCYSSLGQQMGWSKGLGADLTQRVEDMLEPTDIFDTKLSSREQYSFT
jgi:polynucleotide 5'-hydroxyl-kinase GRC3/NOL9